nr:cytochrome c [uncultured Halomonas sp.]
MKTLFALTLSMAFIGLAVADETTPNSGSKPASRSPEKVYNSVCAHCHEMGVARTVAPITQAYPETARETRGNYIRYTVRHGRAAMPAFRHSEVSETELDSLIQALMSGQLNSNAAP